MNVTNAIGGVLGASALVAILYFSHHSKQPPAPPPAQTTIQYKAKPAVKQPVAKPKPEAKKPAEKKKQPAEKPKSKKQVSYHRVNKDGSRGDSITCADAIAFTAGKSDDEKAALAKKYKVTKSELDRYYNCVN